MLIFNPHPMFRRRGIDKPHRALVKAGISAATATKILNTHSVRLTIDHLETLCRLLNCTPNELFIWRPDKNEAANDNLALKALAADTSKQNISEIVKTAPLEKLTQIEKILSEL
jgi:DNA-binding Xre family transcriptional regulator